MKSKIETFNGEAPVTLDALSLCRATITITFCLSLMSKIQSIKSFELTIKSFQIVPDRFSYLFACVFFSSEITIVLMMTFGNWYMVIIGFIVSITLLITFSIALLFVLFRRQKIECNCFGESNNTISWLTVTRNVGLICVSSIGLITTLNSQSVEGINITEWFVVLLVLVPFVLIWLRLDEILRFLRF